MTRLRAWTVAAMAILGFLTAGRALSAETVTIGGVEIPADSPLARKEHPRLLFTKADIPRLRGRLKNPRIAKELQWAKQMVSQNKANAVLLGVLYYLIDDKQYLEQAKANLQPSWTPDYALAADLVMGGLDAAEQNALAEKLIEVIKKEQYRPHVVADLAAWGHGQDAWIDTDLKQRYRDDMVRAIEYNNVWSNGRGGSSMGHGYNGEHFFSEPLVMAVAWSNATGQDWVSKCDYAAHGPEWYLFHYRPWTAKPEVVHVGVTAQCGQWSSVLPSGFSGENLAVLVAAKFHDGLGQWWVDNVFPKVAMGFGSGGIGNAGIWGKLLYYDPDLPGVEPASLPPARLFPENGHAVMRSDWTSDATYALFRCGRFGEIDGGWGRNNADNLHFIINKKGVLAADTGGVHTLNNSGLGFAGTNANFPHMGNYARQTIAHNSITVGGDGAPFKDDRGVNRGSSRRGGQTPLREKSWFAAWGLEQPKSGAPRVKGGDIVAYETSPLLDYAAGDATHSYSPEAVKSISRQFVYLRPDAFVIFDRVVAAKEGLDTIWMLHALYEPAWNGTTSPDDSLPADHQFVAGPDGNLEPNPKPGGHFLHTGGDTFMIDDKYQGMTGRLFAKILWPQETDRTLRTIGGPWHEFEIDGVNYGPTERTYSGWNADMAFHNHVNTVGVSGWRIELSPKAKPTKTNFLAVLFAADQKVAQMPQAQRIESPGKMGAKVQIDARAYEVTFATEGKIAGHVKITEGGKTLVDRDLAGTVEDNYAKWSSDARYKDWMTHPEYKNFIGAKEVEQYLPATSQPSK